MSFDVISPATMDEALDYLSKYRHEIQPIAGGTNLLVDVRKQKIKPKKVLDLSSLAELGGIRKSGSTIVIGPLVTHSELQHHPLLQSEALLMLTQAAGMVGAPAIRNRGTVAGNIQSASPAADVVIPLLALDTKLKLTSQGRDREILLQDFLLGPGETDKKSDELITEIKFEYPEGCESIFYKLGQRNALAISIVSLAILIKFSKGNEIAKVAIALGSVAPTAIRARNVEKFLLGRVLTDETIELAKEMVLKDIKTISDVRASSEYRDLASQALLGRALRNVKPASQCPVKEEV